MLGLPENTALCPVGFGRDKNRPTRVDNEAKACLDDVSLNLSQNPSASLLLVGEDAEDSPQAVARAQQRAINVKDYLVREKGVEAARIKVFTSRSRQNKVEIKLFLNGEFSPTGDLAPVDEHKVKPQGHYRTDF